MKIYFVFFLSVFLLELVKGVVCGLVFFGMRIIKIVGGMVGKKGEWLIDFSWCWLSGV